MQHRSRSVVCNSPELETQAPVRNGTEKSTLTNSHVEHPRAACKTKALPPAVGTRTELTDTGLSARHRAEQNTLWEPTALRLKTRQNDSGVTQVRMRRSIGGGQGWERVQGVFLNLKGVTWDSLGKFVEIKRWGASLVAQWLRIRLPMQGTRVRALVREDPTCRGATKPVRHNY